MDLHDALSIIKEKLNENAIESRHFTEQCRERGFDVSAVISIIKNNKLLGILEQDDGLYKVWFYYENHKDLNIILKILPDKKLKFITVFPCYAEKRIRVRK